jgi:hypothetical protein
MPGGTPAEVIAASYDIAPAIIAKRCAVDVGSGQGPLIFENNAIRRPPQSNEASPQRPFSPCRVAFCGRPAWYIIVGTGERR